MSKQLDIGATLRLSDGQDMPMFGLGVWNIPDGEATIQAVQWALEAGYRHIDTAKIYGNESGVGQAVLDSDIDRNEIWVTTKLWPNDFTRPQAALDESLDRLGLDYVDLYLIHWPIKLPIPGAEKKLWRKMESFVESGQARSIGVSNYGISRLKKVLGFANISPAVNQVECSPLKYPAELHEFCLDNSVAFEGYSPLSQGSGLDNPTINEIAPSHNKSPAQIMIRWSLQKGIITIPKSSQRQHIRENADVFDFELTDDDIASLESLS